MQNYIIKGVSFFVLIILQTQSFGKSLGLNTFTINGYTFEVLAEMESFNINQSLTPSWVTFKTCTNHFTYMSGPMAITVNYWEGFYPEEKTIYPGEKLPGLTSGLVYLQESHTPLFTYENLATIYQLGSIDIIPNHKGQLYNNLSIIKDTIYKCNHYLASDLKFDLKYKNPNFNNDTAASHPITDLNFHYGSTENRLIEAYYKKNGIKNSQIENIPNQIGDSSMIVVPPGAGISTRSLLPKLCYINYTSDTIKSPLKIIKDTKRPVYSTFPKDTVVICPFDSVLIEFPWKNPAFYITPEYNYYYKSSKPLYGKKEGKYTVYWKNDEGCPIPSAMVNVKYASANCIYTEVKGVVFNDINKNGIKEAGESGLADKVVKDETGKYTAITNANGEYVAKLEAGKQYSVNVSVNNPHTTTSGNYSLTTSNTEHVVITNKNFGVAIPEDVDLSLSVNSGFFRPGFDVPFYVQIFNTGSKLAAGDVSLTFPAEFEITGSSEPGSITNSTFSFNFSDLNFLSPEKFTIYTRLSNTSTLGTTLTINANIISGESELNTENNSFSYKNTVSGSFDPNDKLVKTENGEVEIADYLEYTIRFQNTGTDTAFAVFVTDTLSELLDLGTFEMIDASHLYRLDFIKGIAKWTFMNIQLPDSNKNEAASLGFVKFRITHKDDVIPGSIISNKAHIVFDFNDAIETNEASAQVIEPVLTANTNKNLTQRLNPYPVPSDGIVMMPTEGATHLIIYNNYGVDVLRRDISENFIKLNLEDLPKGVYQYQLLDKDKQIYSAKIILN